MNGTNAGDRSHCRSKRRTIGRRWIRFRQLFRRSIRLPAPDEEQRPSPAIRHAWHRQMGTWMCTNQQGGPAQFRRDQAVRRRNQGRLNFGAAARRTRRTSASTAWKEANRPSRHTYGAKGTTSFAWSSSMDSGAKTPPSDDDLPDLTSASIRRRRSSRCNGRSSTRLE